MINPAVMHGLCAMTKLIACSDSPHDDDIILLVVRGLGVLVIETTTDQHKL